jgi:hypothetical protein
VLVVDRQNKNVTEAEKSNTKAIAKRTMMFQERYLKLVTVRGRGRSRNRCSELHL